MENRDLKDTCDNICIMRINSDIPFARVVDIDNFNMYRKFNIAATNYFYAHTLFESAHTINDSSSSELNKTVYNEILFTDSYYQILEKLELLNESENIYAKFNYHIFYKITHNYYLNLDHVIKLNNLCAKLKKFNYSIEENEKYHSTKSYNDSCRITDYFEKFNNTLLDRNTYHSDYHISGWLKNNIQHMTIFNTAYSQIIQHFVNFGAQINKNSFEIAIVLYSFGFKESLNILSRADHRINMEKKINITKIICENMHENVFRFLLDNNYELTYDNYSSAKNLLFNTYTMMRKLRTENNELQNTISGLSLMPPDSASLEYIAAAANFAAAKSAEKN
jgi:hypothetical protein